MNQRKQIGIAVVESRGRYLVGERGPAGPLAGYAEFPGGKCLPDESPFDCAVRECQEESGLRIVADRLLQSRHFQYPHGDLDLYFVLCHPATADDVTDRQNQFRWVPIDQLTSLKFPDGNSEVIQLLLDEHTHQ
jgi:8-oxo-dGTP diphosphatase